MILLDEQPRMLKSQVAAVMAREPRTLLKTHCGGNVTVGSNPTPSGSDLERWSKFIRHVQVCGLV